jgi:hypothetical protein
MDDRRFIPAEMGVVMVPVETVGMAVVVLAAVTMVVLVTMTMVVPPGQSAMAFDEVSPEEGGRDNRLFHGGTSDEGCSL